jgi:hypothetical protein
MRIGISITNHNQNENIKKTLDVLSKQTIKADVIFICSDDKPFKTKQKNVVCINNKKLKGRCQNRNSVIPYFYKNNLDAIIFIDGDTHPKDNDFIEKYEELFDNYDLIFGTREHTDISGLSAPPSDLLTANMDELWQNKPLNYQDLRVVSKAVESWQNATTFNEKLDLMITGMIGWSCNFGFTKVGLTKLLDFMEDNYGRREIFDSQAFSGSWGYEDVAMGLDALYANLNIWISDNVKIVHKSHERTDGLFDHVKGRHLIMERCRNLDKLGKQKDKIYVLLMLLFGFYIAGIITGLVTAFAF